MALIKIPFSLLLLPLNSLELPQRGKFSSGGIDVEKDFCLGKFTSRKIFDGEKYSLPKNRRSLLFSR